jgi:hypothetical protein
MENANHLDLVVSQPIENRVGVDKDGAQSRHQGIARTPQKRSLRRLCGGIPYLLQKFVRDSRRGDHGITA